MLMIIFHIQLGYSKQRWHYLGIKFILAFNQLDLTEGFTTKLVTKFLLNNRAVYT
jgi:hypothetical protein